MINIIKEIFKHLEVFDFFKQKADLSNEILLYGLFDYDNKGNEYMANLLDSIKRHKKEIYLNDSEKFTLINRMSFLRSEINYSKLGNCFYTYMFRIYKMSSYLRQILPLLEHIQQTNIKTKIRDSLEYIYLSNFHSTVENINNLDVKINVLLKFYKMNNKHVIFNKYFIKTFEKIFNFCNKNENFKIDKLLLFLECIIEENNIKNTIKNIKKSSKTKFKNKNMVKFVKKQFDFLEAFFIQYKHFISEEYFEILKFFCHIKKITISSDNKRKMLNELLKVKMKEDSKIKIIDKVISIFNEQKIFLENIVTLLDVKKIKSQNSYVIKPYIIFKSKKIIDELITNIRKYNSCISLYLCNEYIKRHYKTDSSTNPYRLLSKISCILKREFVNNKNFCGIFHEDIDIQTKDLRKINEISYILLHRDFEFIIFNLFNNPEYHKDFKNDIDLFQMFRLEKTIFEMLLEVFYSSKMSFIDNFDLTTKSILLQHQKYEIFDFMVGKTGTYSLKKARSHIFGGERLKDNFVYGAIMEKNKNRDLSMTSTKVENLEKELFDETYIKVNSSFLYNMLKLEDQVDLFYMNYLKKIENQMYNPKLIEHLFNEFIRKTNKIKKFNKTKNKELFKSSFDIIRTLYLRRDKYYQSNGINIKKNVLFKYKTIVEICNNLKKTLVSFPQLVPTERFSCLSNKFDHYDIFLPHLSKHRSNINEFITFYLNEIIYKLIILENFYFIQNAIYLYKLNLKKVEDMIEMHNLLKSNKKNNDLITRLVVDIEKANYVSNLYNSFLLKFKNKSLELCNKRVDLYFNNNHSRYKQVIILPKFKAFCKKKMYFKLMNGDLGDVSGFDDIEGSKLEKLEYKLDKYEETTISNGMVLSSTILLESETEPKCLSINHLVLKNPRFCVYKKEKNSTINKRKKFMINEQIKDGKIPEYFSFSTNETIDKLNKKNNLHSWFLNKTIFYELKLNRLIDSLFTINDKKLIENFPKYIKNIEKYENDFTAIGNLIYDNINEKASAEKLFDMFPLFRDLDYTEFLAKTLLDSIKKGLDITKQKNVFNEAQTNELVDSLNEIHKQSFSHFFNNKKIEDENKFLNDLNKVFEIFLASRKSNELLFYCDNDNYNDKNFLKTVDSLKDLYLYNSSNPENCKFRMLDEIYAFFKLQKKLKIKTQINFNGETKTLRNIIKLPESILNAKGIMKIRNNMHNLNLYNVNEKLKFQTSDIKLY